VQHTASACVWKSTKLPAHTIHQICYNLVKRKVNNLAQLWVKVSVTIWHTVKFLQQATDKYNPAVKYKFMLVSFQMRDHQVGQMKINSWFAVKTPCNVSYCIQECLCSRFSSISRLVEVHMDIIHVDTYTAQYLSDRQAVVAATLTPYSAKGKRHYVQWDATSDAPQSNKSRR